MKISSKLFVVILLLIFPILSKSQQENKYNIIPAPVELKTSAGYFSFQSKCKFFLSKELEAENPFYILTERLKIAGDIDLERTYDESKAKIICKLNKNLSSDEGYKLTITQSKIEIEARNAIGVFYATQSIRQLLPPFIESKTTQNGIAWTVPCCKITDNPSFKYRGMHLDVSRHFSTKEEVMHYIDLIAMLKINTFHWHLTDDQGWRIEIKKYPKLTEIGGYRNRTLKGHYNDNPRQWINEKIGGYYTQDEIKEVIAYAKKRYVNILPEIELPGHAVAALSAYPSFSCSGGPFEVEGSWGVFNDVYCTREETFTFLEDILTEVINLFPYQYIHIGGDECPKIRWSRCYACQTRMKEENLKTTDELQSYFVKRIGAFIAKKGEKFIGWDEILEGGLAPDATVMSWRGVEGAINAAQQGHDVIMTPSVFYLDFYQSTLLSEPLAIGSYAPIEMSYAFNPIPTQLTAEQAKHILGVQANVWTEYMTNSKHREYMIFPRIAALSEVGWLPNEQKDFNKFRRRLLHLLERYDIMGINYSKAIFNINDKVASKDKKVTLSLYTDIPNMDIYYTLDGSEPSISSTLYTNPIELGNKK